MVMRLVSHQQEGQVSSNFHPDPCAQLDISAGGQIQGAGCEVVQQPLASFFPAPVGIGGLLIKRIPASTIEIDCAGTCNSARTYNCIDTDRAVGSPARKAKQSPCPTTVA
jgi:hypothetical protein